jgi:hypothetical protein
VSKHPIPEGPDGQDKFAELLAVADTELLIRFRVRLQKGGRKNMVQLLTAEIEHREELDRQAADARHKAIEAKGKKK